MNDVTILGVLLTMFILLGALTPFISQEFGQSSNIIDIDKKSKDIQEEFIDISESDTISGLNVITSIGKIFFWTFGDLPYLLDILLFIPRIILVILTYRLIRSGGG